LNEIKEVDTEVEVVCPETGPEHLEHHLYEHVAIDRILKKLLTLEKTYDAFVVACFYDPGSRELRELVDVPVVFPAEACMHVAAMLGHKFSIIVPRRKCIPKMLDNARIYGLESRLASMRPVEIPVETLRTTSEAIRDRIVYECKQAIEEDLAEVIILGCTAIEGMCHDLQKELGIPVIDPVLVTFKVAELLAALKISLGLSHSRKYLGKLELGYAFGEFEKLKNLL
jgi:allantoin racemase